MCGSQYEIFIDDSVGITLTEYDPVIHFTKKFTPFNKSSNSKYTELPKVKPFLELASCKEDPLKPHHNDYSDKDGAGLLGINNNDSEILVNCS